MGYTKLVLVFKNSLLICLWCKNTKKKCLLWLFLSILRQNLLHLTSNNRNLIPDFWWLQTILTQVERTGGVYFVPAFSGLFAPHWRWGCFFLVFLPLALSQVRCKGNLVRHDSTYNKVAITLPSDLNEIICHGWLKLSLLKHMCMFKQIISVLPNCTFISYCTFPDNTSAEPCWKPSASR